MTVQRLEPQGVDVMRPDIKTAPEAYRDRLNDLFDTWARVRSRNQRLRNYYTQHVHVKNLGISIPPQLERVETVSGWCHKAVQAHAMRSIFDGYVFAGETDGGLEHLVSANRLRSLYQQAVSSSLVYGVSFLSAMRGVGNQPAVKVRLFSANQACALWDKDADAIGCAVVLSNVDNDGNPSEFVAHFPDAVLTFRRSGSNWACAVEGNLTARPMVEPVIFDPDPDRPLGHSMLTPELTSIVDKAMRDVLRMEVGAEFFTAPQRYILGASEDLFSASTGDAEADEETDTEPASDAAKLKAYYGALWAITRDESGELPQVGEFSAPGADNFTKVFENDAQRFSGATNVPLAQLGVLSNTYTSSDALGAANDPLILEVETMNRRNAETMESLARLMMAIRDETPVHELGEAAWEVQAYMRDPSKSTLAANADAWTKIVSADNSLVGTDVMYEGIGFNRPTISRIRAEQGKTNATAELGTIAELLSGAQRAGNGGE